MKTFFLLVTFLRLKTFAIFISFDFFYIFDVIITARISREGNAIGRVRPFSTVFLIN